MGNNDWIVLNHIIYQIHSLEDLTRMRELLMEQLHILMDYDSADFWLSSPDGLNKLVEPVFHNESPNIEDIYMDNLYALDYAKGLLLSGKNMIYRESDMIPDDQRVNTEFYKKYFEPAGWHHGLNLILGYRQKFLGVLAFYRDKGKPNFQYEDTFILEMLKDHLEYRIHKNWVEESQGEEKIRVAECTRRYGLTRREETILEHLLQSEDNDVICKQLYITNNTLKKHILNLYQKMEVSSRMQLFKKVKEER